MIRPEDDNLHARDDSPHWNESAFFSFMVPERGVDGFVYFWHRPNMRLTAGGVALWDSSGEEIYDCLFHDYDQHQALSEDADMFDFAAESGLTVECLERLTSFRFTYKSDGCDLDLTWQAFMEPHEVKLVAPGVVNPGVEGWATGHYDQGGRMRGVVTVDGEELQIDCWSLRDHSWGPRKGRADMPRCSYFWAVASETSSFFGIAISPVAPDQDPVLGTTERVVLGWYTNDGVVSALASGEFRILERGPDGRPLRMEVDALDQMGRALRAEGRCANVLRWPCSNRWLANWCLTEWTLDGQTAWGEEQDYYQVRQHHRLLRALTEKGA